MRVLAGLSMKLFVLLKDPCVYLLAGFGARTALSAAYQRGRNFGAVLLF